MRRRDRSGKLCVFVFHIGASKNETSLRPSARPRCVRGRLSTLPVADFSASSNVKCRAREWSEWDERHGQLSREVAIERGGSSRDTMEPTGVERHRGAERANGWKTVTDSRSLAGVKATVIALASAK